MPTTALKHSLVMPAPQRIPVAVPKPRTKNPAQAAKALVTVIVLAIAFVVGTVILYGHSRVAAEGYRRVKLLGLLKQEQARSQRLRELNAAAYTPETIESGAKIMGLIRPGDKDMVTAGETH